MEAIETLLNEAVSFYPLSKKRLLAYNRMVDAFEAGEVGSAPVALEDEQLEMLAAAGMQVPPKEDDDL